MALLAETGTWTGSGSTPQTITLSNSSLTPQAIIAYSIGPGSLGSFTANELFSIGFGTRQGGTTQSGCIGLINIDNVSTEDTARVRDTTLLHVMSSTSATDYTVSLDSFGSGQFTVSYSNASNANGDIFHYVVFGGSDITDAVVLNHTMASTGATETVTGAGFQPSVLFALEAGLSTTATITAGVTFSFGWASSNSKYQCITCAMTDGSTMASQMSWSRTQRVDACLERMLIPSNGSSNARWDLDSFDSDGVTLGVVDAPTATDQVSSFLLIQGGQWEAGQKAKATATGNDTYTLTNTSLTPSGVLVMGVSRTTNVVTTGLSTWLMGAGTTPNATRGSAVNNTIGQAGPDGLSTTADRFHATDSIIEELTGGASPSETSEAFYAAAAAGSFTLNWVTNGGVATLLNYMAFGDNAAAPTGPPIGSLALLGVGR